jgi:photolyase PhrII
MPIEQLRDLPLHLLERTRSIQSRTNGDGRFVLYWMRTAVRADENPALDVSIAISDRQSLPILVYHAISQNYEYASDRHHTFMLEGARDVQEKFRSRGISYAFHLATPEDCGKHLLTLAEQAAVVVTEDMPVDPPRRLLNALVSKVATPIICVDTACVVPMQLLNQPYTRAFQFRSATQKLYAERLTRLWPEPSLATRPFDTTTLPFEPLDLQAQDLAELVSRCEIDHSVGPVVDTQGGSAAGYSRWNRFKQNGLGKYAKRRNDALLDGVSRMSAYLHYGMVSPLRIAREAAEINNAGSEKYLDELLIWRELAYGFCFYRTDHDAWSALPDWARATLESHAGDQRTDVYSWEQLATAKTKDALWNAAQTSLLMHGELHNNLRMTWGKAILNWTNSPQDALKMMIDLNHRYALDGRDPASYGGLLWCLGQFDRPFEPASKIVGTVRPRPTSEHARRLDTAKYLALVAPPRFDPIPSVAVIGAGISGLIAARTLAEHGLPVKVFDKGRSVGGRMSSRRVAGQWCFDHGAQYFTARDLRFQRYVHSWLQQGIVARWPDAESALPHKIVLLQNGKQIERPDTSMRFVGTPSMNAVCSHLASGLDVHSQTQVNQIESVEKGLRLTGEAGKLLGKFDRVIVSAPAAQTAELLADFPKLARPISKIQMQPCCAVMASFERPLTDAWVGAFVHDSSLTWVARNSTKPNRPANAEHIILHAGHAWTAANWERDADEVANELLAAFWQASGIPPQPATYLRAHRWKYAIPIDPPRERCFFDSPSGIAACGDWAGGPRVEGAFLSGMAAAGRILGTLSCKRSSRTSQLRFF